ncbi:hypothetical protein [Bacillus sp. NEAU-Y102]
MKKEYKAYPNAHLLSNWGELIKLSRDEVVGIVADWEEIEKYNDELNKEMYTKRQEEQQKAVTAMQSLGIQVKKYNRRSVVPKFTGYVPWFKKNVLDELDKKYPSCNCDKPYAHMCEKEVNGVKLYNNQSPTNLVQLYDRITWQYNRKIKEVSKADKLLVKSIQYAAENGIDIEGLSPKDIVKAVDEVARDKYREEIVTWEEVDLKHGCSECNTYVMGEHRCSCGNARISISIEGDILDGFYYDLENC